MPYPFFTLADLKDERAVLSAKGRQIETEAAMIRYVVELIGSDTDSVPVADRVMVSCCDPLAIALTAAAFNGNALGPGVIRNAAVLVLGGTSRPWWATL